MLSRLINLSALNTQGNNIIARTARNSE